MVYNNSNSTPITPINQPPINKKNDNILRMGSKNWIKHIEAVISESGADLRNNSINSSTGRRELLTLSKDLYKLIEVSKNNFDNDPKINILCRKMNNLALQIVLKYKKDSNETLVVFGSKDNNSSLNQLPREMVDIIAKNMFEAKLKENLDSFKAQE